MDVRAMSAFRRFELAERVDYGVEEALERLEKRKFLPLTGAVEETERWGWVTLEHILDTRFEVEKVVRDPYLLFALRIDRRRVPQNLVRAHLKIEEQAYRNATGKPPGPSKRRELREQVRQKLAEKVLPAAAAYQVIWHWKAGFVWFGNAGERVCETFVQQFEDTFDVALIAQGPRHLALRILEGDSAPIDRAAATAFSRRGAAHEMAVAESA